MVEWRATYGLPAKQTHLCPVCGAESKKGVRCNYHKRSEKRTEYHAAYYRANRERLAAACRERRAKARMKERLRPLINQLKQAVDIGRLTARW